MICSNCGESQSTGATFCSNCGEALGTTTATAPAQPTKPTVPAFAPATNQTGASLVSVDAYAYAMAVLPLLSKVLEIVTGNFNFIFYFSGYLGIIANAVLAYLDHRRLQKVGIDVSLTWGILLPPIYLGIRAKKLGRGGWLAALWLGLWLFSSTLLTFLLPYEYLY